MGLFLCFKNRTSLWFHKKPAYPLWLREQALKHSQSQGEHVDLFPVRTAEATLD